MRLQVAVLGWNLLWILAGCGGSKQELPSPDEIARIGDEGITRAAFDTHLEQALAPSGELLTSEALSALLDQYLGERLLLRLARERGLANEGEPAATALERLLEARGVRRLPSEAALREHYERDLSRYREREQVELEQILLEDRRSAELARRRLAAGSSMESVEKELVNAVRLVDRTVVPVAELPRAVAELIFGLGPGEVSGVLTVEYGTLVFRLVRRIPEQQLSFEQARERIVQELLQQSADRAVDELLAEARSRYAVRVFGRNLTFAYQGIYPAEDVNGGG